jgi:hypothetical protein
MSGQGSRMLHETARQLTDRQTQMLRFLLTHRLATTSQLATLYRHEHATAASALRQTTRALKRMEQLQLVRTLDRRIGGAKAGSTGLVWSLTEPGARLLHLVHGVGTSRRYRTAEPSPMFTEHTLAVTELAVRPYDAQHTGLIEDVTVQAEPHCWRRYLGPHGVPLTLKPDLAATTTTAEYVYEWFWEIDQGSENPARVVDKCHQYAVYRQQGIEQRERGVFPAVVWIASTSKRAQLLRRHLDSTTGLPDGMFTITTIDQLPTLLTEGTGALTSTIRGGRKEDHE